MLFLLSSPQKNLTTVLLDYRDFSGERGSIALFNEMSKDTIYAFTYNTNVWIRNYSKQHKRIAAQQKSSRINQITFRTFRHLVATMEYHKTKDTLHVKEMLGHKAINNTLLYTQLVTFKDDNFASRVAHSEQ